MIDKIKAKIEELERSKQTHLQAMQEAQRQMQEAQRQVWAHDGALEAHRQMLLMLVEANEESSTTNG